MLRIYLPPNLAAAAARDAVALKFELDTAEPPAAGLIPALALLMKWSGGVAPEGSGGLVRSFVQVTRCQLRELLAALEGQPVFRRTQEPGNVLAWTGRRLPGISEYLDEPEAARPEPKPHGQIRKEAPAPAKASGPPLQVDGSEHFLAFTLPPRGSPHYSEILDLVKQHGFVAEPSNGRWWLRDRHKTLAFLATYGRRLESEFGARFTEGFRKQTARLGRAEIRCAAEESGGGFEVTVGLDAGGASEQAIHAALLSGRPYVETPERVVLIEPGLVRRLEEAQRVLGEGTPARKQRIRTERAAEVEEFLETLSPGFQRPEEWRRRTEALRNLSRLTPAPLPEALDSQMRLYQRLGTAWLWNLHGLGAGGILADEMGLGKTLQTLALLLAVRGQTEAEPRPSLVVCPASLLENWRREAARFTPSLKVFVHHGSQRIEALEDLSRWDLILTSYGTLARDTELFASGEFACAVGDEAQHAKNGRSQNAKALRSLRSRSRFLLTGTPIENSLEDLRSHFEFLLPGYVERPPAGARGEERTWFDGRLRAKAAPYILRRTKQAVAPELPEKIEQVIWCEMGAGQAALYRSLEQRFERDLIDLAAAGADEKKVRFAALTQLLRLRQLCCDPRLLKDRVEGASAGSAKLEAFRELVSEALDGGHRLLVFSQFTSLLDLIQEDVEAQGLAYCRLDGSLTRAERQAAVDRFQGGEEVPLFLLSLKAGGSGLNLTAADTVVHLDPWWNPAAEAQATDRAHRIGQTRAVTSYKLVCSGSVEERVLALQEDKRALLRDVFEASDEAASRLSLADLKELVKPGLA